MSKTSENKKKRDIQTNNHKQNSSWTRSWLFLASMVVAVFAASMGIINVVNPELFLYLPSYGYIIWAMLGNRMPPFLDETVYYQEHFRRWARDGDVIISTPPKTGTVWLHTIVYLLRNDGKDYDHFGEDIGWMEMMKYPEDTIDLRLERYHKLEAKRTRLDQNEQHLTHMCWTQGSKLVGLDPRANPHIKYISILRDGKEVGQSIYHFMNSYTPQMRNLWGGYPPVLSKDTAIKAIFEWDPKSTYFTLGKTWWNLRNESNVLLLHYADMKNNHRESIEQIASFLSIDLTPELLETVMVKSSFEYMQQRPEAVVLTHGRNNEVVVVAEGAHIRKDGGKADGGGTFYTPEMREVFDKAVKKHWGNEPDLVNWALRS